MITTNEQIAKKKIGEGIKALIVHLVDNLKSDKIPMRAKKKVIALALQILSLDPAKPLTPKIYSEIMEGIKATQMKVDIGDANSDHNGLTATLHNTKIPVVQVSFQSARQLKLLIDGNANTQTSSLISIANVLPNNIPHEIKAQHAAVLNGNATNIDLLTRGRWGVNLNLKENEWQLGITKRIDV